MLLTTVIVYLCQVSQEACYICPNRKRVRYGDLSSSRLIAGVTTMAAKEVDPTIQRNMFKYLGSLWERRPRFNTLILGMGQSLMGRLAYDTGPL